MTSGMVEEWLRWFEAQLAARKVVLLTDNFSAHKAAVATINSGAQL